MTSNQVINRRMVQYGVWPDCCNNCEFCLRLNRSTTSNDEKIDLIHQIQENIKHIDWMNDFPYGISLLGGELFYIKNKKVQKAFIGLIDTIIDRVLIHGAETCRFSTVTNGLYDPAFLYKVIDRILEKTLSMQKIDVNFSYDLKYRYANERMRLLVLDNINKFAERYNYGVGVQMILTQHVINLWKEGKFDINKFLDESFPKANFSFLYPHPIHTGKVLSDFNFKRADLFEFLRYLKVNNYNVYSNFINSTKNSGTFKYTGLRDKVKSMKHNNLEKVRQSIPILSDGKEEIAECGHSVLYRCYSDSSRCLLCDLKLLDEDL